MATVGEIIAFAGSGTPAGYLYCDGGGYSSSLYGDLYTAIGTTYGTGGGGGNNFNVPDLRGRTPHGIGGGSNLTLGQTGGALTSEHQHGAGSLADAGHTHGPGSYEAPHTHALEGTALLGAGLLGGSISTEDAPVSGTSASGTASLSGSTANASPSVLHPVLGLRYLIFAGL